MIVIIHYYNNFNDYYDNSMPYEEEIYSDIKQIFKKRADYTGYEYLELKIKGEPTRKLIPIPEIDLSDKSDKEEDKENPPTWCTISVMNDDGKLLEKIK